MPAGRVTQRDIARLAGVSQATVSLVLNDRPDAGIAPGTRERVLRAIKETGYVANPAARGLARRRNQIIGVFTYEPVFPSTSVDFYRPFLGGIEEGAELLGCDLLLFTSAPATDGRRLIFHENNRLGIADGCILLGRTMEPAELAQLNEQRYPFIAVGRREDAAGPVPYVGADYGTVTTALVDRAVGLGHRRLAYVGAGAGAESWVDRLRAFTAAAGANGATAAREPAAGRAIGAVLDVLLDGGVTAAFVEDMADAVGIAMAAADLGLTVGDDLSLVALGIDPERPVVAPAPFTGFRIPRHDMGRQAVDALTELLDAAQTGQGGQGGETAVPQRLLPCDLVDGATLGPAPAKRTGRRQP